MRAFLGGHFVQTRVIPLRYDGPGRSRLSGRLSGKAVDGGVAKPSLVRQLRLNALAIESLAQGRTDLRDGTLLAVDERRRRSQRRFGNEQAGVRDRRGERGCKRAAQMGYLK